MALSTAKQQLIDELEARIDAINLATATNNQVLIAGAMYKMAAQVATAQFIDQNSVSIFQNMTPAEFTTWYDDVNNVTALRRLFTDTFFWTELGDNATAVASMLANAKFTADMLTSANVYNSMLQGPQSDLAVNTIMANTTIRDLWYNAGSTPVLTLFNRPRFSSYYAIDPAVVTTIMTNSTARVQFVTSLQFNTSIDNTTIVQNYIADTTSRNTIFTAPAACQYLAAKATPFTAFISNATVRGEMMANATPSQYMYSTSTSYNIIYGNATYYNGVYTSAQTCTNWLYYANNPSRIAAYDNATLMQSWLGNATFRATIASQYQPQHSGASTTPVQPPGMTNTYRYIYVAGSVNVGTLTVNGINGTSTTSSIYPTWQAFFARCGTGASISYSISGGGTAYMHFYTWAT